MTALGANLNFCRLKLHDEANGLAITLCKFLLHSALYTPYNDSRLSKTKTFRHQLSTSSDFLTFFYNCQKSEFFLASNMGNLDCIWRQPCLALQTKIRPYVLDSAHNTLCIRDVDYD